MPYIGNSPKNNVRGRFYYTATAAQTVFSGADSNGKTLAYQDGGYVDVYLNGVLLQDTTDYTATTKTSVTLTSGATAGDLVEIIAYGIFSVGDTVSAANGGTFKNNIDVVGTITSDGLTVDGNSSITGDLTVDTNTLVVDSTNNRVGIGTNSPTSEIHVASSSASVSPLLTLQNTNTGAYGSGISFRSYGAASYGDYETARINTLSGIDDGFMVFSTANNDVMTEAARIDSSGNLLVGKTNTGVSNYGFAARSDTGGTVEIARDGGTVLYINRGTSDGTIIDIRKDNTNVGSIGTNSSNSLYIAAPNQNLGVKLTSDDFRPTNGSGTDSDNVMDLGNSNVRWNDAYITNGVTTGSDANEKQQISVLTDAEIAAAKRISAGFKTFKWNDAVEAKGDNARTHTGVIAQEVQAALEAEGLDAGNYAFWMSNTWWETQTEVPAVAEELDEDDNVITEAQEAYTRTDTYATLEEAPEGATERTRLGIRYPELLAFIGAATEQRLTSIEARLDALETA
jgi:hypothetical protein